MARENGIPSMTGAVDLQGQISAQRGELERANAEMARLKALLSEREAELLATKGNLAASTTVSIAGLEEGEGQLREGVTLTHRIGETDARSWSRPGDVVTTRQDRVTKLQELAGTQLQVFLVTADHFRLVKPFLK